MKKTTKLSKSQQAGMVLLDIARDLTASLAAGDRYERLLEAVRRLVPCDAACLLRLEGDELVPLAGYGLITRGSRSSSLPAALSGFPPTRLFPIPSTDC
jgi:transcriptional regulator with GAF, ATPase, and Fis domain